MNVLLVHGSFGKPFENWFPWLESELAKIDIPCIIPSFPTPNHQEYSDWERLMDYYYDMNVVNEDTVLIGHSCGSVFLVHYLLSHNIKVKGLICVSGYNNFVSGVEMMDQLNGSFYVEKAKICMNNYANSIFAFYGDDDPNIPQSYLMDFAKVLGGEIHCVSGAGHFNASAGYTECEMVLDAVKKCMNANSEKDI